MLRVVMENAARENDLGSVRRRKAKKHTRRWLPILGAVLVLGLIVAGLWPRPIPVETAAVTAGPLRTTVNEEGKTRVKNRFVVSAPVAGQLRRPPLDEGAQVTAGETVVAVIDPLVPTLLDARSRTLAEARRDTAAANLEKARTALSFAESELGRFKKLFAEGTVSLQEMETVELREQSARKDAAAAASVLRQAEAELAEFANAGTGARPEGRGALPQPIEIKAPASGVVLRVFQESARTVTPGMPLLEIGDPTDLEVVIEVLSRDGAMICPGARVELDQWGGQQPLEARVRLVEPAAFTKVSALGVEEQRVNVIADLVTPVERRRNLGDNFRVEAHIITWESDHVLKVPAGALFRRGAEWMAFVVQDGKARLRSVVPGRSSGAETQILEGLKQGEHVILYPGSKIKPESRVKTVAF